MIFRYGKTFRGRKVKILFCCQCLELLQLNIAVVRDSVYKIQINSVYYFCYRWYLGVPLTNSRSFSMHHLQRSLRSHLRRRGISQWMDVEQAWCATRNRQLIAWRLAIYWLSFKRYICLTFKRHSSSYIFDRINISICTRNKYDCTCIYYTCNIVCIL